MAHTRHAEWPEVWFLSDGCGMAHLVEADEVDGEWMFHEKSMFDIDWARIPATDELVGKAEHLADVFHHAGSVTSTATTMELLPQEAVGVSTIGVDNRLRDEPRAALSSRHSVQTGCRVRRRQAILLLSLGFRRRPRDHLNGPSGVISAAVARHPGYPRQSTLEDQDEDPP